jgi:hypothetical protein
LSSQKASVTEIVEIMDLHSMDNQISGEEEQLDGTKKRKRPIENLPQSKTPCHSPNDLSRANFLRRGLEELEENIRIPAKLIFQAMWVSFDRKIVQPVGFIVVASITAAETATFTNCLVSYITEASEKRIKTLGIVSDSSNHLKHFAATMSDQNFGVATLFDTHKRSYQMACMLDRSHLLKNLRNMLNNATKESPLFVNDNFGNLRKIHWGMIIAMYHKESFNCRWNSSHVYLTPRTKMRTSLAVRIFQPLFISMK